jgi:N-acetylmuramic acid 6-phosphate etherase
MKNKDRKRSEAEILGSLATEQPNPRSGDLDTKPALEIARIINEEDATVAAAVARALPQIAQGIDWIADALDKGGRLIYVGAGTSGRLAALDAAEIPPTFNLAPTRVQAVIAGGAGAFAQALEANEDSTTSAIHEIKRRRVGKKDVVVGIAASGRTPFTVAAVEAARRAGARTIAVACNPDTELERAAELAIVAETGAEVVCGSTRMKAGTAQKMVLNMLSTGAMVRLGYVYGNLMVNMHRSNSKLAERSIRMVQHALGLNKDEAKRALEKANNSMSAAVVMAEAQVSRAEADRRLKAARSNVRKAIEQHG